MNLSGTTLDKIEQLYIHAKGSDIKVANNFKSLTGILCGPVDLVGFRMFISDSISFWLDMTRNNGHTVIFRELF